MPITHLSFSADGCSQLIAMDATMSVSLWSLAPPTSASDEPARHADAFRVRSLALRYRLDSTSLMRPPLGHLQPQPPQVGRQMD